MIILAWVACAAPDPDDLFNAVELRVVEGEDGVAAEFVRAIDAATETLHVALPGGDDVDLAQAIVDAQGRGVAVEVVTDADLAASPAISLLAAADVPLALADDGLAYFDFSLEAEVGWTSDLTRMTNAWVVADAQTVVAANRAGVAGDDTRIVFDVRGEDIVDDLLLEHNQLFGGTDATSINAFSNPTKSILETRWRYGTQSATDLQVWFGPQERLTKRVIDAVYSARASAWILTDDFLSDGLAAALQEKAADGFDVQVVVGPRFGEAEPLLSSALEDDTPDVEKRRVLGVDAAPTLVLVDYALDADGAQPEARAMVLTHDILSAPRLSRGDAVLTDQLVDGTMWVLTSRSGPDAAMASLEAVLRAHQDAGEVL